MNPPEDQNAIPSTVSASAQKIVGPVDLLKTSWNFLKKHTTILVSISVVPFIFVAIVGILFFVATIINSIVLMIICAVLYATAVILGATFYPALTNAIHKLSTESSPVITILGQYKYGFSVFWQFILVAVISFLTTWGSTILFIIPGIILIVYSLFYFFTFTIDGKRGFSALTESYSLIKGRWWKVFGRLLVLILACLAAAIIYGIVVSVIGAVLSVILNGVVLYALTLVLNVSLQIGIISFSAIYMYHLYASLKSTRQTEVSTASFKRWLVAFLIIGILAFTGYVALVIDFVSKNAQNFPQQGSAFLKK